jgi:hypothetical protein
MTAIRTNQPARGVIGDDLVSTGMCLIAYDEETNTHSQDQVRMHAAAHYRGIKVITTYDRQSRTLTGIVGGR